MASGPDLFVVCKSCGSEVSPYITECPYCGTRLRKRAPKLERGGTPKPPRKSRPRLAPLRPGEIPGIRPDRRPYVTIVLVVASVIITLIGLVGASLLAEEQISGLGATTLDAWGRLAIVGPIDGEWWRVVTTQFVYDATGYEIAALGAIAIFGTLLERRYGWWAPLFLFVVGGGAGMALVVAVEDLPLAIGGNAAALAMVAAWAMPPILARRAGREDDADLLGVLAIAVLLVLLPLATDQANSLAGLGGGLVGLAVGLGLARLR
jgi:membrane associated rhomboid family serine protease